MTSRAIDHPRSGDIYFVDPFAIVIHRNTDDPPNSEIVDMAVSMHVHGQRRAVECRMIEGDHLLLEHGSIRTAAARLICTGFKYRDPETKMEVAVKNKKFKLKVVISNVGGESDHLPHEVDGALSVERTSCSSSGCSGP